MGITDEAYAKAILVEKLKKAQQEQQGRIKETLDSTLTSPQAGSITLNTAGKQVSAWGAATTTGALHYPTHASGHMSMTSKDLDHEAAKVSLDVLKDMWIMRWQDKWASKEEIIEDDFWRIAFVRLENVNKLERHMLADNMQYVYRIIE